jgi:hypothetical protein
MQRIAHWTGVLIFAQHWVAYIYLDPYWVKSDSWETYTNGVRKSGKKHSFDGGLHWAWEDLGTGLQKTFVSRLLRNLNWLGNSSIPFFSTLAP